jgi:hypothetical protein
MLVAVSCAAFSTLSASAVPDESQFGPCDIMELVMVVDSSESLEPSKELCVSIEVARDGLNPEFHRTVVIAEGGYPVTCSEGFVNDLYPLQPDLDRNGQVGPMDLSMLLGSWGVADVQMDLDRSGAVDAADLARLLGGWGGCR